jgi:aryl-alcohol dehydrogenase-like predicted oxidoreductase
MGMSAGIYGPADEKASLATLEAALEAGITLIDTGDFYGMGHNEMLISRALSGARRERAVLSVKFGALRGPDGAWHGYDARPAAVKNFLAYSLRRLGTDYIDIYRPARVDPAVPIEETVGAIADLVKAGWVRHIGLSEAGVETVRRAHAEHPIADVQLEYSLMSRGIEAQLLPALRSMGIGITAYGVLSRGLLSGHVPQPGTPGDIRPARMPRFAGPNLEQNLALVARLDALARSLHASPGQLALAWVRSRGSDIVPLIGARRPGQLQEAVGALRLSLSEEHLRQIGEAVPAAAVAGSRYASAMMHELDSERPDRPERSVAG